MVDGERLTPKQAEALRIELAELEGPRREEVVAAIAKAREFGDLSENFEYHAAKNEQGLLEARIRTLRHRLDNAEIVEETSGDEVGIGSVVEIVDDGGEAMTVEISAVGGAGTVSLPVSALRAFFSSVISAICMVFMRCANAFTLARVPLAISISAISRACW